MNKPQQLCRKGFFDILDPPNASFWGKASKENFAKLPKKLEDSFYIKEGESSNQWQGCTLYFYESYFVCKSKSQKFLRYLNFDEVFYRVEVIKVVKKKGGRKELTGFSIYRNGFNAEFLCKKDSTFGKWQHQFTKLCVLSNFEEKYRLLNPLGSGGYGKVFLVEDSAKAKYAAKIIKIDRQKNIEKQQTLVKNEIKSLRKVDHPNIIKLYEVYEAIDEICLVMEYAKGERLFDEIIKFQGISEKETAIIIKQYVSILSCLEFKDIIHRDIKPENTIFRRNTEGEIKIKLVDFGLATFNSKRDGVKKGGTAGYIAPEILNNEPYNFKADLYSTGVVMYTCLTGKPLYHALNYHEMLEKNKKGNAKFGGRAWGRISQKGRDLLEALLDPNPSRRISLSKVLEHPWLVAELTIQELRELQDNAMKFDQTMEIPKETTISKIPESVGQIPYLHREPALDPSSLNTVYSTIAGSSYSGLNAFYRAQTKDSSGQSQNGILCLICVSSRLEVGTPPGEKQNILFIPNNIKPLPPRIQTDQSLTSMNQEVERLKFEVGYNIQIHSTCIFCFIASGLYFLDTFLELDHVPDDEENNPCSIKYQELQKKDVFLGRMNFRKPPPEQIIQELPV